MTRDWGAGVFPQGKENFFFVTQVLLEGAHSRKSVRTIGNINGIENVSGVGNIGNMNGVES